MRILLSLTLILLINSVCLAQDTLSPDHATQLDISNQDTVVHVAISLRPATSQQYLADSEDAQFYSVFSVVQSINVVVNGCKLNVPISAYADLVNPLSAVVELHGRRADLRIMGGDGAESYFAVIGLDDRGVIGRSLYSDESKQILQRTFYPGHERAIPCPKRTTK